MRIFFHIFILFIPLTAFSQQIKVSVFNSIPVKGFVIALYDGEYEIECNEAILEFKKGNIFYITLYDQRLLLNSAGGIIGTFDEVNLKPKTDSSKIQITLIAPKNGSRIYNGSMHIKVEYGRILLINETDVEKYIAGVVEAETGTREIPEFQKAQALLCRTYLYSHINRHESEGFNLCDEVHCQVYKGSSPYTGYIYKSTIQTNNKVIVSKYNSLITASFHGNCGGETESSLNTWLKDEEFLVPVKDPYCIDSNNANWEKQISLLSWKKYLTGHGINTRNVPISTLEMKRTGRQNYYRIGKDSILTKQIRGDWNLKSSFFQVLIKHDMIHIKGHGYGHGVGMCQDGAMNMALKGFNYEEIINFYFKGVHLEDVNR